MTQFGNYDVVRAWLINFKSEHEKAKELSEYVRGLQSLISDLEEEVEDLEYRFDHGHYDNCEECYEKDRMMENMIDEDKAKNLFIKSVDSDEIVLENDLKPSETMFWLPGRKLGVTEL